MHSKCSFYDVVFAERTITYAAPTIPRELKINGAEFIQGNAASYASSLEFLKHFSVYLQEHCILETHSFCLYTIYPILLKINSVT